MPKQVFKVVPPERPTRKQRRARELELHTLMQESEQDAAKKPETHLPAAAAPGPFGPGIRTGEYWNLMPTIQPAHQATSHNIAGIYPFVADRGLGHRGPLLGVDLNADVLWHFSPWDLYLDTSLRGALSTNILVLGAYRSGKSGVIKMLTTRSIPFGHQVVVPSDSKGEWVKVAEAVGGQVIALGGSNTHARLNPLDRGPRRTGVTDDEHEQMVRDRRRSTLTSLIEMTIKGQPPLSPMEHAAISWALDTAIQATKDNPTIIDVYGQLVQLDPGTSNDARELFDNSKRTRYVLKRFVDGDLQGLFETHSTVVFDSDSPMVVVDTSELFARGELVAQLTQQCTSAWIQAVISDRAAKRTRYVVREEGWRDMASLAALQMYQQWLKLSRHYGISNIIILHKFSDFDAVGEEGSAERALAYSIASDIENKFIFRVNQQEEDNLVRRLKMSPPHAALARRLRSGCFIGYVGLYSYMVDAFVTSTDWEYELFKTDDAVEAGSDQDVDATETDFFDVAFDDKEIDQLWPSAQADHGYEAVTDFGDKREESA